MTGPRPNYDEGITPIVAPRSNVVATPVDTYVRPATNTPLEQLARSLKEISPEVAQLGVVIQQQSNATDTKEGEAAAQASIAAGAKSWRDAIKAGKVDAARSPFYRAAAEEQFGRNAADMLNRDWELHAAVDPTIQMSYDQADYDKAHVKFTQNWTDANVAPSLGDEHFNNGFQHAAQQNYEKGANEFNRQASARLSQMYGAGFFTEAFAQLQATNQAKEDPSHAAAVIEARLNIGYNANPLNGTMLSQKAADAIAAYAEATGDMTWLDTMKDIKTGGKGTLFETQYGQATYQSAKNKIIEGQMQQHRLNAELADDRKTAALATLNNDVMTTLGSVPQDKAGSLDLSALKVRAVALMGPEGGKHIDEIQQAVVNKNTHDDPLTKRDLFVNIWSPATGVAQTTEADITTAFRNNLLSFASAQSLLADLSKQESGSAVSYTKDPLLTRALGQLKDLYVTNTGDTEEQRVHLWQAEHQLTSDYIDWSEHGAGKGLTGKERDTAALKFLQEKSEEELHRVGTSTQVRTIDKQPARLAPGAPGHVDWKKAIAVSPSTLRMIHNELWKFQNHFQNDLSVDAWSALQAAGVGKDMKEIKEFLDAQEKIQPALVRNPWKPPPVPVEKP